MPPEPVPTCWTLIAGASGGDADARARFAELYEPVVRTYLRVRWRASPLLREVDDATQEVFLACYRPGGVLDRVDPARPGGFRSYLYGVVRNVALRAEAGRGRERSRPADLDLAEVPADDPSLSRVFDRAWARALVREAADRQAEHATSRGEAAVRRVELLRLRFHDGLPIREIAKRWGADPAKLHHEYATARQEFLAALREAVAFHQPGPPDDVEQTCGDLLTLLA